MLKNDGTSGRSRFSRRRRAELLAISAAVAIQNARLYSTAGMYGSELEKRLADLEKAKHALAQSKKVRRASDWVKWFTNRLENHGACAWVD
jgi:hypothetical protein